MVGWRNGIHSGFRAVLPPSGNLVPLLRLDRLADRELLASIMRAEKHTQRAIARSHEMIADTLRQIDEIDAMLRSSAYFPYIA